MDGTITLNEAFFLSTLQGHLKCHLLQEAFPDTPGGNSPPSCVRHITAAALIAFYLCYCLHSYYPCGPDVSRDPEPVLLSFVYLTRHGALDMGGNQYILTELIYFFTWSRSFSL